MLEWLSRWDVLDALVVCLGLAIAVRYWQRASRRWRHGRVDRRDVLRNLGS
jgi:hypothetical protein